MAYSGKVRLISALRDCKQRSLTVSTKKLQVSVMDMLLVADARCLTRSIASPRAAAAHIAAEAKSVFVSILRKPCTHIQNRDRAPPCGGGGAVAKGTTRTPLIKGVECLKPIALQCFLGPTPLIKGAKVHPILKAHPPSLFFLRGMG